MAWQRVDGLRALELGTPGELREELNRLVLVGQKRATAGLLNEYAEEGEPIEQPGERLALLDSSGAQVATVEVTGVEVMSFGAVPWTFARAEGEGDADLEEWRAGHRRFWAGEGTPVTDDTSVVCVHFVLQEAGLRAQGKSCR
jgi:uncharacterized protein YhfF